VTKTLDKDQTRTLRGIFMSKLTSLSSPQKGRIMSFFDCAVGEFNKLAISTIEHRAVARRCDGCGRMSLKGTYTVGKRKFFCLSCSDTKDEPI